MANFVRRLPIALVIPAYNAAREIRAALTSVTAQAVVPAEIIVVDDGSSDRTADTAADLGARVVRLPFNFGPAAARNAGVIAAREEWIAFLDADDTWFEGKLAEQWAALQRWPDAGFCFTDYDVAEAAGAITWREMACDSGYARADASARHGAAVRFERGALAEPLAHSMFIRQSSAIVRRSLFIEIGGYDERLRLSEDYDFFLRMAAAPSIAIERSLVVYNRRAVSLSVDPLAEVASIDHLWGKILELPARYPPAVVRLIEQRRPATLRLGCRKALRLGRFGEAIAFAASAWNTRRSAIALAMLGLAIALNNAPGRAWFRFSRSVWRTRPVKRRSSRLRRLPPQPAISVAHVVSRQ